MQKILSFLCLLPKTAPLGRVDFGEHLERKEGAWWYHRITPLLLSTQRQVPCCNRKPK